MSDDHIDMEDPSLLKPCIHPFDSCEESMSVHYNSPAREKSSSVERNDTITEHLVDHPSDASRSSDQDSGETTVQDGTVISYSEKVALYLPSRVSDTLDDIPAIYDHPPVVMGVEVIPVQPELDAIRDRQIDNANVDSVDNALVQTSRVNDDIPVIPLVDERGSRVSSPALQIVGGEGNEQPEMRDFDAVPTTDNSVTSDASDIMSKSSFHADTGISTRVEKEMLPTITAPAAETEGDDAPSPAIIAAPVVGGEDNSLKHSVNSDQSTESPSLPAVFRTVESTIVASQENSLEVVTPPSTTSDTATSKCEGNLGNESESSTYLVRRDESAAEPVATSEATISPRTPVLSNSLVSGTNGVSDISETDNAADAPTNDSDNEPCETTLKSEKLVSSLATTSSDSQATPITTSAADVHTPTPQIKSVPVSLIQCRMCTLRLRDQDLMVSHISAKHNVDVWYACPYCQLGCSPQRANIVRHIEKSHASQPTEVPINIVNSDKYFFASPTNATSMEVTTTTTVVSGKDPTADTPTTVIPLASSAAVSSDFTSNRGTPDATAMSVDGSDDSSQTLPAVPHDDSSETLTTESNPVADDDDIIFVAAKPGSKRRLVAVRGAPGVTSSMSGVAPSSLQTSLRRPMNVTTSLQHPIMSSVPTMRPAHVNHNNMIPTNTYNSPLRNTAPITSPARPSQYLAHGIPPAHMNNVMSTVGTQARPAHAHHVPPILRRRGPPPLIPLTMLEASRMAEIPRQLTPMQHVALRSVPQAVGVSTQRVHPPRPRSIINIADDDDDEDPALKQSFSVFNLRPRLRTPSVVYRPPGGTDLRRSVQAVRAAPPPYAQRHMAPLPNRQPPTAHQFAPIATPTYNGTQGPSKRCPHCTFVTASLSTLHDHIVSHGSIVRWACPYCPVPPQSGKEVIARHIQTQHPRFPVVYKPVGL